MRKLINKRVVLQLAMTASLLVLFCLGADAARYDSSQATLGKFWGNAGDASQTIMKVLMILCGIIGFAYAAMGCLSLKQASDSAGQSNQNLQKGVSKLIIGGLLLSLPFMLYVAHNAVVGNDGDSGIAVPMGSSANTGSMTE